MYGATRLNKLPLEGRDFRSLRQLHYNKANKGMVCRRPVKDTHPLNAMDIEMNEISAAVSSGDPTSTNQFTKLRKLKLILFR